MSQGDISLRRATVEDIDEFLEVENTVADRKVFAILPDENEARKDALKDIIKYFVYFIERDGKTVGTASYEMKSENHAYLFGVVVPPEFQRQGIARRAVEIILEMLKDIKLIDLVVHPENEKAIGLYKALGFKQIGEPMENYFGDGEPRIKMVLEKR